MENTSYKLDLKSISEILDYHFFIPSYQRGFRWEDQQVLDLLNDIYDFAQSRDSNKGFYCLQPLVVMPEKMDDRIRYRVVDGQQRLTTIYIILKYLENLLKEKEEYNIQSFYTIEYETRQDSKEFLETMLNKGVNFSNPDYFYMSKAYETIKNWFIEKIKERKITKRKFIDVLLGLDEKDIKFIWYELPETEDEIQVFTRLNIGKIPLSNSELIKAVLLYKLDENEKFEIVSEWDYIEKNLQNSRFFAFLTKEPNKYVNTKIDFIFELLAKQYNKQYNLGLKEKDKRFSFYVFDRLLREKLKSQGELWKETKEYFRIFEELFNHNTYYHYVGFLMNATKKDMNDIVKIYKANSKPDFEKELEKTMSIDIEKEFKTLEYGSDDKTIEYLLFLFNVLITKDSGYARYPFDLHNEDKWTLEHIHAQNSENIPKSKRKEILEIQMQSNYISQEIKEKIKDILSSHKDVEKEDFENIQKSIYQQFTDEEDEIHTIDNLALISKEINSSLGNAIFPAKRAKIKILDEEGKFIPLGTKNVFMKYYSDEVGEFFTWNRGDREAYRKVLEKRLQPFIKDKS